MVDNLQIRYGELKDSQTLGDFNCVMAEETEAKKLNTEIVRKGVQNLIKQQEKGFYLIAEYKDSIVGSLMITKEWSDWRNGFFWWIQSVYVLPEFRRKGIFRSLYRKVKSLAENQKDVCGLRLYVDKHNKPALQTYTALGMKKTDYLLFEMEFKP